MQLRLFFAYLLRALQVRFAALMIGGYWLPILSGAGLAFVFYFPKFAPVLFLTFLPAYAFLARRSAGLARWPALRVGLIAGFVTAFAYFILVVPALRPSQEARDYIISQFVGLSPDVSFVLFVLAQTILVFLIAIWMSLPYALWGGGTALLMSRKAAVGLGSAALWVIAEWLRRQMFFDLSWGDIGYAFVEYPVIAASAQFWGRYGIAFIVLLVGALIFEIGTGFVRRGETLRRNAVVGVCAALFLMLALGSAARFRTAETLYSGREIRVAVLQGYLPWGKRVPERTDLPFAFPEPYRSQLRDLVASNEAVDVILLPEQVIHFPVPVAGRVFPEPLAVTSPFWESQVSAIMDYLRASDASVLIVGQPLLNLYERVHYNGLLAFGPDGVVWTYGKRKLFPFVEYMPEWLNLTPFAAIKPGQYSPGTGSPLVALPVGNVFFISCLEIETDVLLHRYLTREPSIILTAGSEIGFSEAARRYQLTLTRFRAIEQDKWVARATKRGFSAVVDPLGRVVEIVEPSYADGMIYASIYARPGKTPYSRLGETPLLIVAIFIAGWCIIQSTYVSRKSES